MNSVVKIAESKGRKYITPEDVSDALLSNSVETVRLDVLEVLSETIGIGAEDDGLCAFIAFEGIAEAVQ